MEASLSRDWLSSKVSRLRLNQKVSYPSSLKWLRRASHSHTRRLKSMHFLYFAQRILPVPPIGENWAWQFVAHFKDLNGAKTCGIMEKKCASALNPATVSNYFELLKMTLTHHNILPKNIYNCDETGCPLNISLLARRLLYLQHANQQRLFHQPARIILQSLNSSVLMVHQHHL